jgi:hypothetical protein
MGVVLSGASVSVSVSVSRCREGEMWATWARSGCMCIFRVHEGRACGEMGATAGGNVSSPPPVAGPSPTPDLLPLAQTQTAAGWTVNRASLGASCPCSPILFRLPLLC